MDQIASEEIPTPTPIPTWTYRKSSDSDTIVSTEVSPHDINIYPVSPMICLSGMYQRDTKVVVV